MLLSARQHKSIMGKVEISFGRAVVQLPKVGLFAEDLKEAVGNTVGCQDSRIEAVMKAPTRWVKGSQTRDVDRYYS